MLLHNRHLPHPCGPFGKPKNQRSLNEFKVKAVQLSLIDGVQVQAVARTLDIHPFMLSRWRKEVSTFAIMVALSIRLRLIYGARDWLCGNAGNVSSSC